MSLWNKLGKPVLAVPGLRGVHERAGLSEEDNRLMELSGWKDLPPTGYKYPRMTGGVILKKLYKLPEWTDKSPRKTVSVLGTKEMCKACGWQAATDVDHKIPARALPEDEFFNKENLQVLCDICHGKKTDLEMLFFETEPEKGFFD